MRCVTGLLVGRMTVPHTLTFDLEGDDLPIRLDLFLRRELPDISRTELQRLIRSGAATVNGQVAEVPSTKVGAGDTVQFDAPGATSPDLDPVPQNLDFDVVHADDDVIVVDKPASMAVHAGAGRIDGTLVNGLIARFPEIAKLEPRDRPGIVHRLDADTSGLMVVARNAGAATKLSAAIKAREVQRFYIALVAGRLPLAQGGIIDQPIGRHPRIRTRQAVVPDGRLARTRFFPLTHYWASGKPMTLVQLKLETGRTHQIRVHMQAIGYPVIGDPTYGITPPDVDLHRQFLHAHCIEFHHPATGELLEFNSQIHDDLANVLTQVSPPSETPWGAEKYPIG